ncbi:Hypothetical predicted protein [Pelobates cultripes]|uniref:Uncharacterized protein n=1 Tax=Pelobates cultripes TaxID=61616 RepID=A0AAD1WEK9_PELCU|nr:Hypothetical predicted protein [Pelobates cultripes]
MADHVATLEHKIATMEARMADAEDRSWRNNLRLRGVPESILPNDLQAYVQGLLRASALDIPTEMFLVEHRVPKPRNLPDSIPRDVLLRAHYFHIKEAVLRASRNSTEPYGTYAKVKILADLSAATLKCRRDFHLVTEELRRTGIRYRWGYPTKLLITKNGELKIINTPDEGTWTLREWGLATDPPPIPPQYTMEIKGSAPTT